MKKILVLGSTGMLGHMVFRVLSQEKDCEVLGTQSHDPHAPFYYDVMRGIDALGHIVNSPPLQGGAGGGSFYFINCIGVLSGGDEENMKKVNAEFPHLLAKATSAKIIHMSTNGVFASRTAPYKELEPKTATDNYGKTKSLGEVVADHVLNIRTSIVGPSPIKKRGLFEWFRSQPDGTTVQGYTNHFWNGVTTLQFAELCRRIITGNHFEALRREGSAIHFVPNTTVTKYELLTLFQKLLQKRITIQPTEDPRGVQAQLLACTSKILPSLFPHNIPMEQAVNDLLPYL